MDRIESKIHELFLNAIGILDDEIRENFNSDEEWYAFLLTKLHCTEKELRKYAGLYLTKEGQLLYATPTLNLTSFKFPVEYFKTTVFLIKDKNILRTPDCLKNFIKEETGYEAILIRSVYVSINGSWNTIKDLDNIYISDDGIHIKVCYVARNTLEVYADNLEDAILYLKDNYMFEFDKLDEFRERGSEFLANFYCSSAWDVDFLTKYLKQNYNL